MCRAKEICKRGLVEVAADSQGDPIRNWIEPGSHDSVFACVENFRKRKTR
jgi:hypothetical protein